MADSADNADSAVMTGVLSREQHVADMANYLRLGEARAVELANRGPVRLNADGTLHHDILAAFDKHGFYVFEGVVQSAELDELRHGAEDMISRAPVRRGEKVDAFGRPALGHDYAIQPYLMVRPLSDPWGGTAALGGRHPSKMTEPVPDADAPENVVYLMFGMCQAMPAALRLYGHPDLLAIAASVNGADFVPYNDAIFVKQPGLGGSVSWHQDGITHWDSPHWDHGIHGFNFQVQLYRTTAANGLWVLPGTHRCGRVDIKQLVADSGGFDRLRDAVPLLCEPGDVTIVNRQMVHGSFANSSQDLRISLTFGFHRRKSVLGQKAALAIEATNATYDEQRIFDRAAVIQVAIDARHQAHPTEPSFTNHPFATLQDQFRFTPETFERVIRDYNTKDLAI